MWTHSQYSEFWQKIREEVANMSRDEIIAAIREAHKVRPPHGRVDLDRQTDDWLKAAYGYIKMPKEALERPQTSA